MCAKNHVLRELLVWPTLYGIIDKVAYIYWEGKEIHLWLLSTHDSLATLPWVDQGVGAITSTSWRVQVSCVVSSHSPWHNSESSWSMSYSVNGCICSSDLWSFFTVMVSMDLTIRRMKMHSMNSELFPFREFQSPTNIEHPEMRAKLGRRKALNLCYFS